MKICKIEGCSNKHHAKGYCKKHYEQIRKYGKILERTMQTPNEIIEYEDYAEIILYNMQNEEIARTLIDLDDVDKVKEHKWYLKDNYVWNGKERLFLHRFIMNPSNDMVVDHINHNPLDNRKENLRICTQQQNLFNQNSLRNNTSGFTGICWLKSRKKWLVQIKKV